MIPLKGIYLLLIIAGPPEQIGLKQELSMSECMTEARAYATTGKYAMIQCIQDGAIVSPSLAQRQGRVMLDAFGLMGLLR